MKNIFKSFIPVALSLFLSASYAFAEPTFSDLSEEHWAYPQIQQLAKDGIVVGYPDGTYKPDEKITRAEFASMAVKALKQQEANILNEKEKAIQLEVNDIQNQINIKRQRLENARKSHSDSIKDFYSS